MDNENRLCDIWVNDQAGSSELRIDFTNERHYALEIKHKTTSPQEVVFKLKELVKLIETEIERGLV